MTVTLSRPGGGIGPTLDHVAQSDKVVMMVNAKGERAERNTDSDGVAHFDVSPGDYDVRTELCAEAAKHVTVTRGATVRVVIACIAA